MAAKDVAVSSLVGLARGIDKKVLDILDISDSMTKMWRYVKRQRGWSLVATSLLLFLVLALLIPATIISDLYPTYGYANAWVTSMAGFIPPFLIRVIFYVILIGIAAPTVIEVVGSRLAKADVGRIKGLLFMTSCWDFVTDRQIVGMIIDQSFMTPICGNTITSAASTCDAMGHYTFLVVRAVLHATGIFIASYGLEAMTIIFAWGFLCSLFLLALSVPGAARDASAWLKSFSASRGGAAR